MAYDGSDEDLTVEVLEELVADNPPDLHDILIEAVEHPDRHVRIFAALKLAELYQDVDALPGLYEALNLGSRAQRRAAAEAVWEIGDADAAGLIRALHFTRGNVREAVAAALELVGWLPDNVSCEISYRIATRNWRELIPLGAEAVSGLVSALSDPDGNIRRGAAWTLGQIGDPRAVPFLIDLLHDAAGDMFDIGTRVCDIAAEALIRIGTADALAAVEVWRAGQTG